MPKVQLLIEMDPFNADALDAFARQLLRVRPTFNWKWRLAHPHPLLVSDPVEESVAEWYFQHMFEQAEKRFPGVERVPERLRFHVEDYAVSVG